MKVVILQSNYVPWRGYFDLMDDADVFIVYDEVQYTKSDWRNRNKLKTPKGTKWMTVPVRRDGLGTRIDEARINWDRDWSAAHVRLVTENYKTAPYFDYVAPAFFAEVTKRHERLATLNVALLKTIAERLAISTRIASSSDFRVQGGKSNRLVELVKAVGGKTYISGPSAAAYLDLAPFERAEIAVEYKNYDYAPYPQPWGAFEGAVSVLDLLMNTGPGARKYLKSLAPNRRVLG